MEVMECVPGIEADLQGVDHSSLPSRAGPHSSEMTKLDKRMSSSGREEKSKVLDSAILASCRAR